MWPILIMCLFAPGNVDDSATDAEWSVVRDARAGRIDRERVFEAGLTFSSAHQVMRSRYCELLDEVVRAASGTADAKAPPRESARRLIDAMHEKILRGPFDPDCSSIEEAFTTGRHNCVTSLILALEMCRRAGIPAKAMQHEHHVWLRVGDTRQGDLETTKVAPGIRNEADVQSLSDAQLLCRLLYNQARNRHQQGDYAQAAQRLEWCLTIDPGFDVAERNLRIVLGNWTSTSIEAKRFSEASAVNRKALAKFPNDEAFERHAAYLQQEWADWNAQSSVLEPSVDASESSATR